ncbi:MAG TPA: tRNA (cytidine(34)-2'-O)-methyltransferase [Syntrophomonadaceae bacterium]|nr:tRNA (cytidine(34)-2'-O)-methyltransferase [Syntrophomonadaceae bacterium]
MHIVLMEPEIPQNTGNIARTCALTKTVLHLVKPLGFSTEDRYLKRAGLDYWDKVEVHEWESFAEALQYFTVGNIYFATTKTDTNYNEKSYTPDDIIVFGAESKGLSDEILDNNLNNKIRIPMLDIGRSLNLANSVAIILYEALRQQDYPNLA